MMTQTEKAALFENAADAMREWDRPIKFDLDIILTVGIIGQLQLAFRHPSNLGPTRELVESFVRELIENLDPDKGALYELLTAGFDPEMDE